ncbi:MAG: FAD binding domain-containing protein [Segetibacter sp.]
MVEFILNNKEVSTDLPRGMLLLDFVRYYKNLTGTKIGCREGDCGACTVLIGELQNDEVRYRSFTSCLTPLGNIDGKHVVTIEGVNMSGLNPVQQAMCDNSATQCGFCTPGFIVSLAGFCLSDKQATQQNAIAAVDGNICRCTGYKSIERAAAQVAELMQNRGEEEPIKFVTNNNILPAYFSTIKQRLKSLSLLLNGNLHQANLNSPLPCRERAGEGVFVGGGTDLYVQKHDEMKHTHSHFMFNKGELNGVSKKGNKCIIGPSATVTDLYESEIFKEYFPQFKKQVKLISSTPIRNMATIGGNFINASPIGDFTIFFLALDATLVLSNGTKKRELPLRNLYKGYKTLDRKPEEFIAKIYFDLPDRNTLFNFEKVSKRTNLDIASVNSAISISMKGDVIKDAHISAGGVGPVPMLLKKTSSYLAGKVLSEELITEATEIAQSEISPISDARGTEEYKRLLLSQLIKAHFITLFPTLKVEELLLN